MSWKPEETSWTSNDFEGSNSNKVSKRDPWLVALSALEKDNVIREKIGLVINNRYKISSKISFGAYGVIYTAEDLNCDGQSQVAVKFEIGQYNLDDSYLKYEHSVYEIVQLENANGGLGFPKVHWFGCEYNYQIMVMDLLGPTLDQLFTFCNRRFSLQTVCQLGSQMLDRIRHLHERGYVHRDIKTDNFLMGIGATESLCHLIDFGLARQYRRQNGRQLCHISFRKGHNLVGTDSYASLNSHNGFELSRRDDLESLGYIIAEFITGNLPWKFQRTRFRSKKQDQNRVRRIKEQTDWTVVCPPMADWFRYCRHLRFDAQPDYSCLYKLLSQVVNQSPGRRSFGINSTLDVHSKLSCPRFDWLTIRDRNPDKHYAFQCLFRWTLDKDQEPEPPPNRRSGFGFHR